MDKKSWLKLNIDYLRTEYENTPKSYKAITDFESYCTTCYLSSKNERKFGNTDFHKWLDENGQVLRVDYEHKISDMEHLSFDEYCVHRFQQSCYVGNQSNDDKIVG